MNNKYYLCLLFLLVNINFSNCASNFLDLLLEDQAIIIRISMNPESYFHLSLNSNFTLPKYIQILVKPTYYDGNINNYIISYYGGDINFKNRTKFSISKSLIIFPTYIWLNQDQIKNGFYFKVEVQDKKAKFAEYQIEIKRYDYIQLDSKDYFYQYYVTEKNGIMEFLIKEEKEFYENQKCAIIFWAEGSKPISVDINTSNYVKHSKYNVYIITNITEFKEYIITVKGSLGDFIDIGVIFIDNKEIYNELSLISEDIIKIFLKRNILEKICFNENNNFNFIIRDEHIKKISTFYDNNKLCVKLPDDSDELFFYRHYLGYFGYPLNKNSPIYYSLLLGNNYFQTIPANVKIGYIPLNIDEDFNFLTYRIYSSYQLYQPEIKIKVYIANCNDYPLCIVDKNELEKSIILYKTLNFYTFTFNKEQLKEYISPIGYKRKILFIECNQKEDCEFFVNINSDKSNIHQKTLKEYYFINKEINTNILLSFPIWARIFKLEFLEPTLEIHFEQLSGNIHLTSNRNYINYKGYYLFALPSDKENIEFNINSKQNSIYSIKYCYIFTEYNDRISYNKYIVPQNGNYLFNFNFKEHKKIALDFYTGMNTGLYYTIFYPINCEIEVEYENLMGEKSSLLEYKSPDGVILFHDIAEYGYYNILSKNYTDSCMIYSSSYLIDNVDDNMSENSILLRENNPQVFLFNEMIKEIKYSYYFGELDDIINLELNILNSGNFMMTLYFNYIQYKNYYNISSNIIIKLTGEDWNNTCMKGQICNLFFVINKLDDFKTNSFIKININSNIYSLDKNIHELKSDSKKIRNFIILMIIIALLMFGTIFAIKSNKIKKLFKKRIEDDIEMKQIEEPLDIN